MLATVSRNRTVEDRKQSAKGTGTENGNVYVPKYVVKRSAIES